MRKSSRTLPFSALRKPMFAWVVSRSYCARRRQAVVLRTGPSCAPSKREPKPRQKAMSCDPLSDPVRLGEERSDPRQTCEQSRDQGVGESESLIAAHPTAEGEERAES